MKSNHRFKQNKHYNFIIVFLGLLFGTFLILPDEWRKPQYLLGVAFFAALIAKFVSSTGKKSDDIG